MRLGVAVAEAVITHHERRLKGRARQITVQLGVSMRIDL